MLNALSNIPILILVVTAAVNGEKKSNDEFVVVCMHRIDKNGNGIHDEYWEPALHGDPLMSADRCGCGELVDDCNGIGDICEIRRKHRSWMYNRKIYVKNEVVDCIPFLQHYNLTPKILCDHKLLDKHRMQARKNRDAKLVEAERKAKEEAERRAEGAEHTLSLFAQAAKQPGAMDSLMRHLGAEAVRELKRAFSNISNGSECEDDVGIKGDRNEGQSK